MEMVIGFRTKIEVLLLTTLSFFSLSVWAAAPPSAPILEVSFGIKQLRFGWSPVSGATHYKLYENRDGVSGFTQVGGNIPPTATQRLLNIAVHRHNWTNALYLIEACTTNGCTASNQVNTTSGMLQAIGYFKASNAEKYDNFGSRSVSLSADGKTLVVGAPYETSGASGVGGNQVDDCESLTPVNCLHGSGATYVFSRTGNYWSQQAYIKAANPTSIAYFGNDVVVSADGNTLAVSALAESSGAYESGAVYIFTRAGGIWSQQAIVKATDMKPGDRLGGSIALSGDGNTLVADASGEDSAAAGVNGNPDDDCNAAMPANCASDSGAVYVFTRSGGAWTQQAFIKSLNPQTSFRFGTALSVNSDGSLLGIGTTEQDGQSVHILARLDGMWSQQDRILAPKSAWGDSFGFSLQMNSDGNTLAISAASDLTVIEGSGAVYVYTRSGSIWSQQAYLKASNPDLYDFFGTSLALSADGNTLAAGSQEDSAATGINGDQTDNSASAAGAVYVFKRTGTSWAQRAYVKASNTEAGVLFGSAVALSADGGTLAVGSGDDSAATGIGSDQTDNSAISAGAVYLY